MSFLSHFVEPELYLDRDSQSRSKHRTLGQKYSAYVGLGSLDLRRNFLPFAGDSAFREEDSGILVKSRRHVNANKE